MKRTRLTQDEQALRQRLEARAIPSPSRAIRARVMEAAQAALRDEATPLSAPRQNHLRRRFAFSLVTLSALAALVVVVAHLHFETRKEAIPASRLGMPTSTSHGPRTASSTTAMPARQHTGTLRQVDGQLRHVRTRIAGLGARHLRPTSTWRRSRPQTLLQRTGKLRKELARWGV